MNKLYLECNTGLSGDMAVASLIGLGADEDTLLKVLKTVPDHSFEIKISHVKKSAIDCMDFDVVLDKEHENHDHDMEYLYGDHHEHEHDHEHHHHEHHHGHDHGHTHHEHDHFHRPYSEVKEILSKIEMTDGARALSEKIFAILAEAEAAVHGMNIEDVTFHEVGAIDSIVDIVSFAVCFDNLKIDEVIIPKICEGQGHVMTRHGKLPVPVPAVLKIAELHKLPISITERQGEFITPTGAAIAAAIMTGRKLPETMSIVRTGYGAGKREYEPPSMVRAVLFEEA